jgi:hypothetical protein
MLEVENMKFIGLILFLWLTAFTVPAADFPEPFEIIRQEGQFVFTDGSSYYLFRKDHTFKSGPLGISGREITRTWKSEENFFVINGQWGWLNGGSQKDDYRQMILYVAKPEAVEKVAKSSPNYGIQGMKIYKCYFEIESLQKIPKP